MIWEDSVTQLKHFNDKEHFSVSFIGEPGADGGGLKREFFSIMLKKIQKNNSLLDGSPEFGRVVRHNTIALQEGLFLFMGKLFAMSIVHGGPSPTFFARSIVEYLFGGFEDVCVDICEVPDPHIRELLEKVLIIRSQLFAIVTIKINFMYLYIA